MHIKQGEKIAIIGESGSGKTTLLNIIHGEETPTSGQISFAGQNLSRQEITSFSSYILQDSHYFDTLSLGDNILLGLDKNKETFKSYPQKQDWNIWKIERSEMIVYLVARNNA